MNSESGPLTLKEAVRQWTQSSDFSRLSPSTQKCYGYALRLLNEIEDKPIADIAQREYFNIALRLDNNPSKLLQFKAVVKRVQEFSYAQGWIETIHSVPAKAKRTKRRDPWPEELLLPLLHVPNSDFMSRAMFIAYHTAQRIGDILALKWDAYNGKELVVWQQKTDNKAIIPCSKPLKRLLDQMERRGDYLIQEHGSPFTYATFYSRFRRRYPVGKYPCFHAIRHSAATKLAEMGASPHEIGAITGHKALSSVQRYTTAASMAASSKKLMDNFE